MSHARAFELLPWLVNGSLRPAEREAVEAHARDCLVCRRELKEQQQLRAALRSQPAVHISAQSDFDKLSRRLGEPAERSKRWQPLGRFAAVASIGIAVVAALVWIPTKSDGDKYSTLATQRAPAGDIDIVFVQSITAADMRAVLDEIGAKIAAGPSDIGRYTVRLQHATDDAAIAALLERLHDDPRVRFAGRALAPDGGP
jgi:anti-sigma factor RsiW